MAVLDRMIARRGELARLLGFSSWADYAVADKMVGSAANASAFIDRVAAASEVGLEPGLPDPAAAEAAGRARRDGGEPVGDLVLP